jgi:carboxylate-amine ligase
VHVGVAGADRGLVLQNRLRQHLPLLLAISANSPFWQGRNTGLASTRIPIFQAFPRTGVPRAFLSYDDYVDTVDQLLRCEAFPAPTFLWWDVRPQPRLGTVEVRIMDSQSTVAETAGLAALIQTIAHMELEAGPANPPPTLTDEVLHENRFLAARDGMEARFIDSEWRVPARLALAQLVQAAREHAQELGCEDLLDGLAETAGDGGAARQIELAERHGLDGLTAGLAEAFLTGRRDRGPRLGPDYQRSRWITSAAGRRLTGPNRPRGHPTGITANVLTRRGIPSSFFHSCSNIRCHAVITAPRPSARAASSRFCTPG